MKKKQNDTESDYFGKYFNILFKAMNFSILFYVVLSSVMYIIIHFYGKTIIKGKSQWIEYDQLLYINLFNDLFLIVLLLLGYFTLKKKSNTSFIIYWSILLLISFNHLAGINVNIFFLNPKLKLFNFFILIMNVLLIVYTVCFWFGHLNYIRNTLASVPIANIIHEINLRSDMMKISFNHLIIRLRLHKLIPNLTYKKSDFYFLGNDIHTGDNIPYISVDNVDAPDQKSEGKMNNQNSRFYSESTKNETHIYS
jgi:hypothetical protein